MEPDFKTQYHSLNFSLKGPIVLQQLLTGWGWGEQSQDCPLRVWVRTSNSPRSKPASPRPEGRITHGRGCRPCGARPCRRAAREAYLGILGSCHVLTPVCVCKKYTWPCTVVLCSARHGGDTVSDAHSKGSTLSARGPTSFPQSFKGPREGCERQGWPWAWLAGVGVWTDLISPVPTRTCHLGTQPASTPVPCISSHFRSDLLHLCGSSNMDLHGSSFI